MADGRFRSQALITWGKTPRKGVEMATLGGKGYATGFIGASYLLSWQLGVQLQR